jgi:hypothetical protein
LDREDPNYNDPDLIDSSGDIGYWQLSKFMIDS